MKKQHPNQEAINLKKEIAKIRMKADILYGEADAKYRQMQSICLHDETEEKPDYVPGGYLDREQFIKRIVCKACGKVLMEKITTGGFN